MEGNQLGIRKRQDLLVENRHNSGSCWRLTLDVDVCGAGLRTATASPILKFCFTLDKVGVLEYSRSVTQKIDL